WFHYSAAEMLRLGQEAWAYSANKNFTGLPPERFKRSRPFSIACQPFYRLFKGRFAEFGFQAMLPVWTNWLKRQRFPACDVVHSAMSFATEPFDHAERIGALKVLDASNSHPTSFHGFWQREIDIWSPGSTVGVWRSVFARCNRELERADVIICASTYVRDSMIYNGIPESKLEVNPFGADLQVFSRRTAPPDKPRFLFAGVLTLRKGIQYLLPAFERLKKEVPGAELILCGPPYPDGKKLIQQTRHLFTYRRGLNHAQLAELMRTCTAFVFPSIEEGFARVISEAMASGLAIIATHNSGATTVVEDGKEGFIVPARSSDTVYQRMKELAQNPELCKTMGNAAATKMERGGSWADYSRKMLDIYNRHLGDARKSRTT